MDTADGEDDHGQIDEVYKSMDLGPIDTNMHPVIGIIAQPLLDEIREMPGMEGQQWYVQHANVVLMESAGARVVPIPLDIGDDELNDLLDKINGVFFPGSFTGYSSLAR